MGDDQRFFADLPLTDLVAGALDSEAAAWDALVERLQRVVWKAVNMMTFDPEIRDDAFAATWLRLAERLATIREPDKLPGWLATTACNEVRQILRQRGRFPIAPASSGRAGELGDGLELADVAEGDHAAALMLDESRRDVRTAFAQLDDACREILTVLVLADPPVPYDEASARLGRPIGALGPSRRRCLDKMRKLLDHDDGEPS